MKKQLGKTTRSFRQYIVMQKKYIVIKHKYGTRFCDFCTNLKKAVFLLKNSELFLL